jgi:hypothetical protein
MLRATHGGAVGRHLHRPRISGPPGNPSPSHPVIRIRGQFRDLPGSDGHAEKRTGPGEALLVLSSFLFGDAVHRGILSGRPPGVGRSQCPFHRSGHRNPCSPSGHLYALEKGIPFPEGSDFGITCCWLLVARCRSLVYGNRVSVARNEQQTTSYEESFIPNCIGAGFKPAPTIPPGPTRLVRS